MKLEDAIKQKLAEANLALNESKAPAQKQVEIKTALKTVDEDTLDAMEVADILALHEDIEQLDELSKKVLSSYFSKMSAKAAKLKDKAAALGDKEYDAHSSGDFKAAQKAGEFREKAVAAVNTAIGKIDKVKPRLVEQSVSSQVAALLESEGLSDEFKEQAVTIFEAAVTDRVLQIQEELEKEFDAQLAEAKEQMDKDIDGFLNEAIAKWQEENQVAIETNFASQRNESFMDGLSKLIAEHNIEVPEGKEDALEVALEEVEALKESAEAHASELVALQEQISSMKAEQILESFKSKMTQTEFDRFKQLVESVEFVDAEKYTKQLNVVLENFGSKSKAETKPESVVTITESTQVVEHTVNSNVAHYAAFLKKK